MAINPTIIVPTIPKGVRRLATSSPTKPTSAAMINQTSTSPSVISMTRNLLPSSRGLRLGGTATRKRNVAILGYRREKRSFFIRNNLFRNRKSRTMASAKLADQKGPEQMRAETRKLRSVHPPHNPENRWLRSL
jgi:hypothetical protein